MAREQPLSDTPPPPLSSSASEPADNRSIRVEFAINLANDLDLKSVSRSFESRGARVVHADINDKIVLVELATGDQRRDADVASLQKSIETETGFVTVVKGIGQQAAAVAELRPSIKVSREQRSPDWFGVVRLSQLNDGLCYADGLMEANTRAKEFTVKQAQRFILAVHEYGDLSGHSYDNLGQSLVKLDERALKTNQEDARISMSRVIPNCNVASLIGKSIALTQVSPETAPESTGETTVLSAGVIARASTIQANTKQVCACSGKTLWEERIERR